MDRVKELELEVAKLQGILEVKEEFIAFLKEMIEKKNHGYIPLTNPWTSGPVVNDDSITITSSDFSKNLIKGWSMSGSYVIDEAPGGYCTTSSTPSIRYFKDSKEYDDI